MNLKENDFEKNWQESFDEATELDSLVDKRIQAGIFNKIQKQKKRRKVYFSAAAVILLGGLLVFSRFETPENISFEKVNYASVTFFETQNENKKITLSDGSEVTLLPHSSLQLSKEFGKTYREVSFKGKANFSIAKDKTKPFRIDADGFTVQVLGTKFFLDQTAGKQEVQLFEGKVKISHNDKITYLLPSEHWKMQVEESSSQKYLAVTDQKHFSFDDEDFGQIIAELESVYNVKIAYPKSFASKKIKGTFKGNLEDVLSAVSYPFNLSLEKKSKQEIILK